MEDALALGVREFAQAAKPGIQRRFAGNLTREEGVEAEGKEEGQRHDYIELYPYIAGTPIIPTGLDYSKVYMNGNVLLASINSHLENEDRVGNILINADGEVIRSPKPSVLIREADERTVHAYIP